jgi:hypothetical protein
MSNAETLEDRIQINSDYEVLHELMDMYGQAIQQLVFTYVSLLH